MNLRKIHSIAGLIITIFIAMHLFNHVFSVFGTDTHIELMSTLRFFYRNVFAETLLIMAVFVQIFSGLRLFRSRWRKTSSFNEKLHVWTGLYLAIFFTFHLGAVMGGRYILQLDTNFYFGAAGLNTFPFSLFFIPYYALAILSFFGHISSIHRMKIKHTILGITPTGQSKAILLFGVFLTLAIFYGLTNQFNGIVIPKEYGILIGDW